MFADDEGIEKLKSREKKENHNPYASAWEGFAEDLADPEAEMFMGVTPEKSDVKDDDAEQEPSAEQTIEAGESGEDPSERRVELEPEEIDDKGEITQEAFDNWREAARKMFDEVPGIERIILINRDTKKVVAIFSPDTIGTITRDTATEDPQEINLLDNRSDEDPVNGVKKLSESENVKDRAKDDDADIPDNLRINDITQNSTDTNPFSPSNNLVAEAISETAGLTGTASSVDVDEVVKKLRHKGISNDDIAEEADKLADSVEPEDLNAGSVGNVASTKEEVEDQKTIAANAAIAGTAKAVKGEALTDAGKHEEAIEAADEAKGLAEGAEAAVESIPSLDSDDNDVALHSTDMRTRQAEQLAQGAKTAAEDVTEKASKALADEESDDGSDEETKDESGEDNEPTISKSHTSLGDAEPGTEDDNNEKKEHATSRVELKPSEGFTPPPQVPRFEVTTRPHVVEEPIYQEPEIEIPSIIRVNEDSSNPQDEYNNLIQSRIEAEHAEEERAKAELRAKIDGSDEPHVAQAIIG